jgi:hypothetical protein
MDENIEMSDVMAERFIISYYYASPQDFGRINAFRECSGDSEKALITQYVRGWIGRNRDYYLDLARKDAAAREISFPEWGEIVVAQGIEALPPYQQELSNIPPSPLRDVALTPSAERKTLNYISLGKQNLALLKVGVHYDRDNTIGFVSRIVKEHLDRNWEKLYASQVEAENFKNWK